MGFFIENKYWNIYINTMGKCNCKDTKGKRSVRLNPMDKNTQHRVMMDNKLYYWTIFVLAFIPAIFVLIFLGIKSKITKKPIDLGGFINLFIKDKKLETAIDE